MHLCLQLELHRAYPHLPSASVHGCWVHQAEAQISPNTHSWIPQSSKGGQRLLEELVTPAVCFCAVGSSPKTQVLVLLSGTSTLSLQFPFYIIYHTVLSCVKDSYKLFSKSTFPSLRSVSCNNLYFGSSVLQQMAVWFVFSSCSVMGTQFVNVKLLTRTRGWIPRPPRSTALPGAQTEAQSNKHSAAPDIRAAGTGLLALLGMAGHTDFTEQGPDKGLDSQIILILCIVAI